MSGMAIQREDLPDLRPTERLSSLAATRVAWGLRGSVGPFVEIFDANEQLSTARVRISSSQVIVDRRRMIYRAPVRQPRGRRLHCSIPAADLGDQVAVHFRPVGRAASSAASTPYRGEKECRELGREATPRSTPRGAGGAEGARKGRNMEQAGRRGILRRLCTAERRILTLQNLEPGALVQKPIQAATASVAPPFSMR